MSKPEEQQVSHKTIVNDSVIEGVLLKASRIVEVRISQFRALLAFLLLIFSLQWQLQSPGSTPRAFLSLGVAVSVLALGFSAFVISSYKKKKTISVTLLAICSIGLDATLLVLPVSIYFSSPPTPSVLGFQAGALLNQPTVFAMYLLVIASGLRFYKVALLGIVVNSFVILSLMFMEILGSRLTEHYDPVSVLAIKQHALLLVCSALLAWLISTHTRVTTQKAAEAVLRSTTDALTGAYNRHFLRQHLEELSRTPERSVHLLMVDADKFKSINDNLGHLFGDKVLIEIAHRLQQVLRTDDLLARYGGEEFCVVLPDIDDVVAVAIAERLRKTIEKSPVDGHTVTVSIGLSRRVPGESMAELIERADQALYRSKEGGRNQVQAEWPEGDLIPSSDIDELAEKEENEELAREETTL